MPSVILEGKYYFYKWEEATQLIYVFDSNMKNLKSIKVQNFNQESKAMQKTVVLAIVEAVTKVQKADEMLEGLF